MKNEARGKKIINNILIIMLSYSVIMIAFTLIYKKPEEYLINLFYELRPVVLIYLSYKLNQKYFDEMWNK